MKRQHKIIFIGILLGGFMMLSPLQAQEHGQTETKIVTNPAKLPINKGIPNTRGGYTFFRRIGTTHSAITKK